MADFGQNVLASSVALLLIMAVMGLVYFLWSKANMKKKVKYFEHIPVSYTHLHVKLRPIIEWRPADATSSGKAISL